MFKVTHPEEESYQRHKLKKKKKQWGQYQYIKSYSFSVWSSIE